MAEFPTTNLRDNLIAAGLNPENPADTYVDFADKIAKNIQDQQQMEVNMTKAKLMTRQAKVQTMAQEAAQAAGYNHELAGTMTKDQAIAEAKATTVDPQVIEEWAASLPPIVEASQVENFISRFSRETNKSGQPFVATAKDVNKHDENGDPLIAGQTYAAVYDNKGKVSAYVRSGQEKADPELRLSENRSQFAQREWNKFIKQMNPYTASGRNSVGVSMQSFIRAVRALKAFEQEVVTSQVAGNVIAEIGAIYKGGSPDQAMMEATSYRTLAGDINDKLQHLTGKEKKGIPDGLKKYIVKQITELNDTSKMVIKNSLDLAEEGNEQIIEPFREQWNSYKKKLNDQLENPHSNIAPGVEHISAATVPSADSTVPSAPGKKLDRLNLGLHP